MLRSDAMTKARKILNAALDLPARTRGRVAASLIDSLDGPRETDASAAWDREVDRRLSALDDGQARTIPWSEVDRGFAARRRARRR